MGVLTIPSLILNAADEISENCILTGFFGLHKGSTKGISAERGDNFLSFT